MIHADWLAVEIGVKLGSRYNLSSNPNNADHHCISEKRMSIVWNH